MKDERIQAQQMAESQFRLKQSVNKALETAKDHQSYKVLGDKTKVSQQIQSKQVKALLDFIFGESEEKTVSSNDQLQITRPSSGVDLEKQKSHRQ